MQTAFDRLSAAIEAVFPDTEIQQCIIHQIRIQQVCFLAKELKPLMADLKRVYTYRRDRISRTDSFVKNGAGNILKSQKSWKDNLRESFNVFQVSGSSLRR